MKRMNLMIDEDALKAAMLELGETTASGTVNKALAETARKLVVRRLFNEISGSGAWVGDLQQMRAPRFDYPFDLPESEGTKKFAAKTVRVSRPKAKRGQKRSRRQ